MTTNYIGIDLGGTKVLAALFNAQGQILHQNQTILAGRQGAAVGAAIVTLVRQLLEENNLSAEAKINMGICVPGIAYSQTGHVWAPNIAGWKDYPLKKELEDAFPRTTITIESDRTCYILGEKLLGAARGCSNAVFMAVGTGIGAGILIDGRVLHGASDIIGAIGWMALLPPYSDTYTACGCFESFASGNGIAMQARERLKTTTNYNGLLRHYDPDTITSHEVFEAFSAGDPLATEVITKAVELWGMATANLVSIFNPEIIIFGGGVFGPATVLIEDIYQEACKWAQPVSIRQCRFVTTQLPKLAGLYGAGAVAIKNNVV